jgi:hypothetical protein
MIGVGKVLWYRVLFSFDGMVEVRGHDRYYFSLLLLIDDQSLEGILFSCGVTTEVMDR